MTVSGTTTPTTTYNGNDSTVNFTVPFQFVAATDLVVVHTDGVGAATTWTKDGAGDTGYTVSGSIVTANTAPATGETLLIYRETDIIQGIDFQTNRQYNPELIEGGFDRLTLISQEIGNTEDMAGSLAESYKDAAETARDAAAASAAAAALSAAAAGQYYYVADPAEADQGVTATGTGDTIYDILQTVGTSKYVTIVLPHTGASTTTVYTIDTSIDMTTYPFAIIRFEPGAMLARTTGDEILTFYSSDNIVATDRQKITIVDMMRFCHGGVVYPEWWGAVSDNSTDCTNAIQYAVNSVSSSTSWRGTVKLWTGFYKITAAIRINASHFTMEGLGPGWHGQKGSAILQHATDVDTISAGGTSMVNFKQKMMFKNMSIGATTPFTAGAAIAFQFVNYAKTENVQLYNHAAGVTFEGCTYPQMHWTTIAWTAAPASGTLYGVLVKSSENTASLYIDHCNFIMAVTPPAGAYGFIANTDYLHDISITATEFIGKWIHGAAFVATGSTYVGYDIHVEGNIFDSNTSRSIYFSGLGDTATATVANNWIAPNTVATSPDYWAGVYMANSHGVTVTGNQIMGLTNGSNSFGVVLNNCDGCSITANTIAACGRGGVYLSNGSSYNTITANVISSPPSLTSDYGVITASAETSNTIVGNVLRGYMTTGIGLAASTVSNILDSNTIETANIGTIVSDAGTGNSIRNNTGYKTENSGTSGAIATGATIAHGLDVTPTYVNVTPSVTGLSNIYCTVNATNITVNYTGGGTNVFYWFAESR